MEHHGQLPAADRRASSSHVQINALSAAASRSKWKTKQGVQKPSQRLLSWPPTIHVDDSIMDLNDLQHQAALWLRETSLVLQKVPGSAVVARYVQSSYQNDPVRSAIELVLVIFFLRYILSPSYSTQKENYIKLRDDVRFPPSSCPILGPPEPREPPG